MRERERGNCARESDCEERAFTQRTVGTCVPMSQLGILLETDRLRGLYLGVVSGRSALTVSD